MYYWILQTQSFDVGIYDHYITYVEPALLQYDLGSTEAAESLAKVGPISKGGQNPARIEGYDPERLIFRHSPSYLLLLRVINVFSGGTLASLKFLVLPKLLIYLSGMYALLYLLTGRACLAAFIAVLSIVPRHVLFEDAWGVGPLAATQAKDIVYAFFPWLMTAFFKFWRDPKSMCLIGLGIGCLGNIHGGTAFNIMLLLLISQLFLQSGWPNKLKITILPAGFAFIGVLPFLIAHLYATLALNTVMTAEDAINIEYVFSKADRVFSAGNLYGTIVETIRPLANLYTLALLAPIGVYFYSKYPHDKTIERILKIQIIYVLLFIAVGFFYAAAGLNSRGYVGYIGRTGTFIYLYVYIFVAFAFAGLWDRLFPSRRARLSRQRPWAGLVVPPLKILAVCLAVLVVFPPLALKPNRYFPAYDFESQINDIKKYFTQGFNHGALDPWFTEIADYINGRLTTPHGASFAVKDQSQFVFLTRRPTYAFPRRAVLIDNQLGFYDQLSGLLGQGDLMHRLEQILFNARSYEDYRAQFVKLVVEPVSSGGPDYFIIDHRYDDLIPQGLLRVHSNEKYLLVKDIRRG